MPEARCFRTRQNFGYSQIPHEMQRIRSGLKFELRINLPLENVLKDVRFNAQNCELYK